MSAPPHTVDALRGWLSRHRGDKCFCGNPSPPSKWVEYFEWLVNALDDCQGRLERQYDKNTSLIAKIARLERARDFK